MKTLVEYTKTDKSNLVGIYEEGDHIVFKEYILVPSDNGIYKIWHCSSLISVKKEFLKDAMGRLL
jgi:hypothetical protein